MIKKFTAIFLLLLCTTFFGGCRYSRQVNEMAYVVGMGVDKGENENVLLSLQFAKPMVVSGKGGGGEEEGEKNQENKATSLISAEGENIFSAMSIIESSLSKQINLTHTKLLLFSEEIAKEGILKYTESLMGNNQFRPNTFVAVANGGAKKYFEKVKPALELNPAKYYTLMFSKDTKSTMPEMTLRDLYFSLNSNEVSAVLPVVGTLDEGENDEKKEAENVVAGQSGKEGENKTESSGMAVFKDDKLTCVLPSGEAEIYNIITGKYQEGYFNFSQNEEEEPISLRLKIRKKPEIFVETDEGVKAKIKIKLSAEVISYPKEKYGDYSELEKVISDNILKKAENYIKKNKELMCDTVGFGKYAKKNFMTQKQWEDYNWKEKFLQMNVSFDIKARASGGNLIS